MRLKLKDTFADMLASWRQTNDACHQAFELRQTVDQPMVLISQVQRSGGSLMSQLFDDHPEVHAHPHTLNIGYPQQYKWPPIDVGLHARENFKLLLESQKFLRNGYNKVLVGEQRLRFYLPSVMHMEVFSRLWAENPPSNERDILNAYFTSYFSAWLNYSGWSGHKKYLTAFTPRLLQQPQDREKFWQTYPTGWHIAIVRRPDSWLHSAEKESKLRELSTNAARLKHWRASVESILEGKKENPDRVIVVEFEDFVANTSDTMCRIAEKLGIRNDATLSIPTFNGEPISSNSSFGTAPPGKIDKTVIDRKDIVEKKYSQQVDDEDFEIYERARNVAD